MGIDFADLTIVQCTKEQVEATFNHHHPHWGVPRGFTNIKDYYARERGLHNESQPWYTGGRFTTWALVPRANPTTIDLLASCETYQRKALVLRPGETEPTDTVSYGIASVFCQLQHRGNAYPRHLLSVLHYVLAPASTLPPFPAAWGAPPQIGGFGDAAFSVLYSDVGPTYYSRATKGANEPGWVSVNLGKLAFPAEGTVADTDRWKWLDMEEAHALEATASRQICRDLPLTGDKTKTRVAILPDNGWFKNNPQRYFLAPPGAVRRPDVKFGAVLPSDNEEKPYFVWTINQEDDGSDEWRLVVSHVFGDVPFEAVVAAAKSQGCKVIESWLPYGWNTDGATVETDHSVSCLAEYGLGDVEWEFCEKYAWM